MRTRPHWTLILFSLLRRLTIRRESILNIGAIVWGGKLALCVYEDNNIENIRIEHLMIVITPEQARKFADILKLKADHAEVWGANK